MTTLAMTNSSDGTEAAIDLDPRFLLIDGRDAVVTRAIQRLRLHRNEWPLAVDQGPNYFGDAPDTPAGEGVLGRGNERVQSHLAQELRKAGIQATGIVITRDPDTREWRISPEIEGAFIDDVTVGASAL